MNILQRMTLPDVWQDFLQYKIEKHHLAKLEQEMLATYIAEQRYLPILKKMKNSDYVPPIPEKKVINKDGAKKKRIVYSYPEDFNMVLKMIAFLLYEYDGVFANNCYAFRRNYGVKDAIMRIRRTVNMGDKYCLKTDISNYFNSIDVELLLDKLQFLKKDNEELFRLFAKLLKADVCQMNGEIITESRGAMAGTPVSPFFANVYLSEVDHYFQRENVLYFRYSDDILLFADDSIKLQGLQRELYDAIAKHHLSLNPEKVQISAPGEPWEFLGFSYVDGRVDLSQHTKVKIKKKIKRKAEALRRWARKKGLTGEHAAKGFIKAMNYKFFAMDKSTEFTWSRWFFPNLTTDKGLKEIDAYMQQNIRYCVTGKHNKGNYQITYDQMKRWGYRNLVHEYYKKDVADISE
ncbi:MAG: group II intron reverse transcriptase domain-containing protein [Lachnospiraceae bacterium]|nr:group II intron reverse transcriptase domain-containing protein [Lachnospiraceae bacterium]